MLIVIARGGMMEEGDAAGVTGTPTTYLDGSKLDIGAIFADMEKGKAFMERMLAQ